MLNDSEKIMMGNFFSSKPKKTQKKPKDVFAWRKEEAQKRLEEIKNNSNPENKRKGRLVPSSIVIDNTSVGYVPSIPTAPPDPFPPTASHEPFPPTAPSEPMSPTASSVHVVSSYDDVALNEMRYQLDNDANAFLLNNILLSVQFFENYEREVLQIKDKREPITEKENLINDAMIRYNKHVFFADRLQECVSEHVNFQRNRGQIEPLASPKVYVIHDNLEAREPGDTSDYSAALDAPFYKLQIEDCKASGFLKLKKLEVLESNLRKKTPIEDSKEISDDSVDADSGNEYNDDKLFVTEKHLFDVKPNLRNRRENNVLENRNKTINMNMPNLNNIQSSSVIENNEVKNPCANIVDDNYQEETKPKKSILKKTRKFNTPTRYTKAKDRQLSVQNNIIVDESEQGSSGYGSILSGGSTLTESAVPKRIELLNTYAPSSGVVSDDCWTGIVKKVHNANHNEDDKQSSRLIKVDNDLSDENDDEIIDAAYKSRILRKEFFYLNSWKFMNTFITNFKKDLGVGLGFSQDEIKNAMTHGASIYCDSFKDYLKTGYEIVPGLTAALWPNAANLWIIRERNIIINPRNNYQYQWPVEYMVNKARGFGCVLVPLGLKPKIGSNPDQKLQWKIVFPEAERYLENLLAHSQIRCYLFTLALHKAFMENETMIGIDASHIKNHLFWECEDNFAKWPEDRLGESLRSFLESFYTHFSRSRLPNYFMERCNEFESIPSSVLLLLQKKLKDILETLVMHMLYAIDKLKYNSIGFYPTFDSERLYNILTSRDPLYFSNPNLPGASSSGENSGRQRKKINANIKLPQRLGTQRRNLVLKFFIPHFIAMARSSEKFDAINQAMIYLEQAQRLCLLLLDEPNGNSSADEYLEVIRDKLTDCQRKKMNQDGFKLSPRQDNIDRPVPSPVTQQRKIERNLSQDSIVEDHETPSSTSAHIHKQKRKESLPENNGIASITIADIHVELRKNSKTYDHGAPLNTSVDIHKQQQKQSITKNHGISPITIADIHVELRNQSTAEDDVVPSSTSTNTQKQKQSTIDHGISPITISDIHQKEQHIQLDDSDIEESYL